MMTRKKLVRIRRAHNRWRRKVKRYYRHLSSQLQPPRWEVLLEGLIRATLMGSNSEVERKIVDWYYTVLEIHDLVCEAERTGVPVYVDVPDSVLAGVGTS